MRKLLSIAAVSLFIFNSCKQAPKSDEAFVTPAQEETKVSARNNYTVDVAASKVEWIGTKVSGYHTGTVKIKSGELNVSGENITAGKFVLDMTTIVASGPERVDADANAKLTGHLMSPDFFDTQKFPEASFVITGVKAFTGKVEDVDDPNQEKLNEYKVANPTHTISGNLTVKGIEKNIEFPAAVSVNGNNAEARAKFNLDRKEWNLEYTGKPDDLIRDEFHLGIYLKATK